ncbi:ATP-binding protein [Defluviimonas salinarum]|uniref:ATP-binding protein n=1 Tax=Defluviimonas salinarum TaxID=2992147 RepID=A0ABT3J3V5_9RHOB|nr:ATP-binding protein [Defluviimonas salinarum]MCW3782369.1 ATP-binding protein [Defluviimonas salinarum]
MSRRLFTAPGMISDGETGSPRREPAGRVSAPSTGEGFHLCFEADPCTVRRVLGQAVAELARGLSRDDAGTLELALAEVLNNIVEHAYDGRTSGQVEVCLHREAGWICCRIVDSGHAMPALTLPEGRMRPLPPRLDDLPEGGWGWSLIRTLATDLAYRREDGSNYLTFRLPLSR